MGRRNGSIGQLLASQAWSLEFKAQNPHEKATYWSRRDSARVKSLHCPWKGPEFDSQHQYQVVHNCLHSSSRRSNALSGLHRYCIHMHALAERERERERTWVFFKQKAVLTLGQGYCPYSKGINRLASLSFHLSTEIFHFTHNPYLFTLFRKSCPPGGIICCSGLFGWVGFASDRVSLHSPDWPQSEDSLVFASWATPDVHLHTWHFILFY